MTNQEPKLPAPDSNSAGPSSTFQLPDHEGQEQQKVAVPEEVVGARQAWLATSAMQACLGLVTAVIYWLDPASVYQSIGAALSDSAKSGVDADAASVAMRVAIVVFAVTILVICGLFVAMTKQMQKGAYWARFILMAGSGYLVLEALLLFVSSGPNPITGAPMWLQFINGALVIGSAAAATAGIVLSSTKNATEYFVAKNPKIFDKKK